MIKQLQIENFGKFENQNFDFSPVTLFYGENEAGKTTLFDILFDKLCSPNGRSKRGKPLADRYGKYRSAEIVFSGEELQFTEADFFNLFAVRSGDITLQIDKDSEWMNNVKAALFSGGIDPLLVANNLDHEITTKAKGSYLAEKSGLVKEIDNIESQLEHTRKVREECLAGEKKIINMNSLVTEINKKSAVLRTEIQELEKTLQQQNLIRDERTAKDILSLITESRQKKAELEIYSRYTKTILDDLKLRDNEVLRLKMEIEKFENSEKEAVQNFQKYKAEKDKNESEKNQSEKIRTLAEVLRDTLPKEKPEAEITHIVWRKPLLVVAAIALVAGIVGFFLGSDNFKVIFLLAGVILAIILLFSAAKRTKIESTSIEDMLRTVREKWRKETGEDIGKSYEEILVGLNRAFDRSAFKAEQLNQSQQHLTELEQQVSTTQNRMKEAEKIYLEKKREQQELFQSAGVSDVTEYVSQLTKKENLTAQFTALENKIRSHLNENHASTIVDLETLLNRKMNEIGDKLTQTEISPQELKINENKLRDKKYELEELHQKEKLMQGDLGHNQGTISEKFRGIPEKIAAMEKELTNKENRLEEIELELQASEIARNIFQSLSGDSDTTLQELSKEIGTYFSVFTNEKREIALEEFSIEKVAITDAGGSDRYPEFLSAGTQDAFLLAARLVLAQKSQTDNSLALIILDEPFITMDRRRIGQALASLEKFRIDTGCQIIIFTKDEIMESQAKGVFGDKLQVNKLSV